MKKLFLLIALTLTTLISFAQVSVKGYYRKDGTYVKPHMRSNPDGNPYNNWSYPGNTNPYTGKTATGNADTYLKNYYGSNAYRVNATYLNVYSGASTDYSVLYKLTSGDHVQFIERYNSTWAKVNVRYFDKRDNSDKSKVGYVLYNSLTSAESSNEYGDIINRRLSEVEAERNAKFYYVSSNSINLRKGPSTSAQILKAVKHGEMVEIIEFVNSDWAKVEVSHYNEPLASLYNAKYNSGAKYFPEYPSGFIKLTGYLSTKYITYNKP